MPSPVRELFTRLVMAMNTGDYDVLSEIVAPDFEGYYPQSGERFRGLAAFRAQLERYPGGLQPASTDPQGAGVLGGDERRVITPGYTVLPLAGPERYTTVVETTYPDGSRWHVVSIVQIRDGRLAATETYFAPAFEPPEWRSDIVEVVPKGERSKP